MSRSAGIGEIYRLPQLEEQRKRVIVGLYSNENTAGKLCRPI